MSLDPDVCVEQLLTEADRLGVLVRWSSETQAGLKAAYHASFGKPGIIVIQGERAGLESIGLCTLLTHEMVHVLQHWRGSLQATPPLGWPINDAPAGRRLSTQEAEAYTAEKSPEIVIKALEDLKTPTDQQ